MLKPGVRVRFHRQAERFPDFIVPAGSTGTLEVLQDDFASVKVDQPVPGAESWDNECHFNDWDGPIEDALAREVEVIL